MLKLITHELREHAPFTALGAISGIIILMIMLRLDVIPGVSSTVFYVLHPLHIVLSAMVTTAMYRKYGNGKLWTTVLVGYLGSIGIATVSDSLIPYLGESLLDLPNRELHLGFTEKWWVVNPAALLGITISYIKPMTRFPHYGHVLVSTWASSFHIIMALGASVSWFLLVTIFLFLFLAVWLPCCLSDIIFPLLFTGKRLSL